MVSGFYLTLEVPSELSVALCMTHAVLPKEAWLAERHIHAEWPVWGVPRPLLPSDTSTFKEFIVFRWSAILIGCYRH